MASQGATPFQVEGWVEWSLGVAILLLRLYARWKAVGFKGWKGDDYFSMIALVLWTVSYDLGKAARLPNQEKIPH